MPEGNFSKNLQSSPGTDLELSESEIVNLLRSMEESTPYPIPDLIIMFRAKDESQLIRMLDMHAQINFPAPGHISRGRLHVDVAVKHKVQTESKEYKRKTESRRVFIRREKKTKEMYAQDLLNLLKKLYPEGLFDTEIYQENLEVEELIDKFPSITSISRKKRQYLNYLIDRGYIKITNQFSKSWYNVKRLNLEIVK